MNKEKPKNVVVYARVSTDKEEQKLSIQNQKDEIRNYCKSNGYNLLKIDIDGICDGGVYYDSGTSGTKLSRPAFNRMLLDAGLTPIVDADTSKSTTTYKTENKPKFDAILVKDTSRFARNVSVNQILEELKRNGVIVYFLDKDFNTRDDMSMIQMFFMFAEQESRDKSKKVSFGYQSGARQGKLYFGGKMIGYDYDKETNCLIINEEEAKLVQLVFDMYTEQEIGQQRICNELDKLGYYNSVGHKYTRNTIRRMLENEKYCGINNCGRYHKDDLFSNKRFVREYDHSLRQDARKAQEKQLEQGIVKIPPIISVEQFEKAQKIIKEHSELYKIDGSWHGTTDYAKKIVCGCCGSTYVARGRRKLSNGYSHCYYACRHATVYDERNGIKQCHNPSIREDRLDATLNSNEYYTRRLEMIDELIYKGQRYIDILEKAIDAEKESAIKRVDAEIESLQKFQSKLLDLYAEESINKADLLSRTQNYQLQIDKLTADKRQLSMSNDEIRNKISQFEELIAQAKKEYKSVNAIVESSLFPKVSRKELLRNIESIVIDIDGNPIMIFKNEQLITDAIQRIDANIDVYIERAVV